jgi:hypothetical protein
LVPRQVGHTVTPVRIELGPITSTSAAAWAAYARAVLEGPAGVGLADDVRADFAAFVRIIERASVRGGDLRWAGDLAAERIEFLALAFYRLSAELFGTLEPGPVALPEEAVPFYQALVRGVLGALASERRSGAAFAEDLADFWPGLDPVDLKS